MKSSILFAGGKAYAYCKHYCLYLGNPRRNQLGAVRLLQFQPRIFGFCRCEIGGCGHHVCDYRAFCALAYPFAYHHRRRFMAEKQTRGKIIFPLSFFPKNEKKRTFSSEKARFFSASY